MRKYVSSTKFGNLILIGFPATLMMLRNSIPAWNTVWAEDGTIFYPQVQNISIFNSLTQPYNGSYLFLTRLLFIPMRWIPIKFLSYYTFTISFLTYTAILGMFVILLKNVLSKQSLFLLCSFFALNPMAGAESLQNINNLPWFWVIGWSFYTYFGNPTRTFRIIYLIMTLIFCASLPLFPIFVVMSLFVKSSINYWRNTLNFINSVFLISVLAIGWIQLALSTSTRVHNLQHINVLKTLFDGVYRITIIPALGILTYDLKNSSHPNQTNFRFALTSVSIILILSLIIFIFKLRLYKTDLVARSLQFAVPLYILTAVGIFIQHSDFSNYYFSFALANGRYFVTSGFALIFIVVILNSFVFAKKGNRVLKIVLAMLSTILIFSSILNFSNNPSKFAPNFPHEIANLKIRCELEKPKSVAVYVSPANNLWKTEISCSKIKQ